MRFALVDPSYDHLTENTFFSTTHTQVQMKVHVVVVGADWRTSEGGRERATGEVHPGSDGRGLEGL